MSTVRTTHYAIFDYWKNKAITDDGFVVDKPEQDSVQVVYDWGEPCCWGCDKPILGVDKDDKYAEYLSQNDYKRLWDHPSVKHNLNRCHMVAESLNGVDAPDNLFLLCYNCHSESPDTTNKEAFLRWVYSRRKQYCQGTPNMKYLKLLIDTELAKRKLPSFEILIHVLKPEQQTKITQMLTKDNIKKYLSENTTTHEFKYNLNSMVISMVDLILTDFNDVTLGIV